MQRAIEVDAPRRTQLLRHLVVENAWPAVLVFVATKYATEHVADKLRRAGLAAAALHGELSQGARTQALADFKAGRVQVLLATDLAARGLDIARLPAVVNFDLPRSAVDYTHRIGRTGRAGETGVAISFVSAETHAHFRLIEKRHRLEIPREQVPGFEPVALAVPQSGARGIKGKRQSKKDRLREAAART
jgi:superfamily II DNA/RNA helicase